MKPDQSSWTLARNVLGIRLDTMGDVLMTTPALRAIKNAQAQRRLTLLTSSVGAAIARLIPEVDRVLSYAAPWMKATAPRSSSEPDLAFIEQLRREHFDAAVIFTTFSQSPLPTALMCYLANIPLRLAYCHENPYQLLTHWIKDEEPQSGVKHEVRRQLDLVQTIGCFTPDERLSLQVPKHARERIKWRLAQLSIDLRRPWVVIHPGAFAPSRRYPPLNFALVARELIKTQGWQVIFTGLESERRLVRNIQTLLHAPSHSLVGELNLAELAALIELAPLLIVNNTGPAHIAAAVGTPLVDLYALTNPQHTPWHVRSRVLSHPVPCQNCFKSICPEGHHNCLRLVSPAEVVAAAIDLMDVARLNYKHLTAVASPSALGRNHSLALPHQPTAERELWVGSEAPAV